MACKVIYNSSNNVTDVFADNGAPSILWRDLKELVGNGDTAYDNYVRTQTKAFKSLEKTPLDLDVNNEPTIQFVVDNMPPITPAFEEATAVVKEEAVKADKLDLAMKNFLSQIGVSLKIVDQVTDRDGNPMSSIAIADMLRKVVEIANGKADITTLPEEAAHFLVEILEKTGNPLFNSMYNSVPNYNIYAQTIEDYKDRKDYQGNDHKLRKEAMAKVIAQKVVDKFSVEEDQSTMGRIGRWMDKVIRALKKMFGLNTSFDDAAFELLNVEANKYKNAASEIQSNEIYEQADLGGKEQDRVINAFKVDHKALRKQMIDKADIPGLEVIKEFTEGEQLERYVYTDPETGKKKTVTNRTTDDSNRSFIKFVRDILKKDPLQINSTERSLFTRNQGTVLHGVYQNIVENFASGKAFKHVQLDNIHKEKVRSLDNIKNNTPGFELMPDRGNVYKNASWVNMRAGIRDVLKTIDKKQSDIDSKGTAKILTEVQIYDPKEDKAGTIDMVVVYSDGSVAIYDWKNFINPYSDYVTKPGEKAQLIKGFTDAKIDGWNTQIGIYRNMLKKRFNVDNFRELRIIPVHVQFNTPKWKDGDYTPSRKIEALYMGNKGEYGNEFLRQISVAGEKVGYPGIDKLIRKLRKRRDKIQESLRNIKGKRIDLAKTKRSLKTLNDQIQRLIVDKDLLDVLREAGNNAAIISEHAGIMDESDPNFISPTVLRNALQDSKMFDVIVAESQDYIDKLVRNLPPKEALDTKAAFNKAAQTVRNHGEVIKQALFNRAIALGEKYDENLKVKPKKLGSWSRLFTQMSQIDHPIFRTAYREINHSFNKTKAITDGIYEDIQKYTKAIEDAGISKEDAYKLMIKDTIKNGKVVSRGLVGKYSAKFLDELEKRKESGKPEDIKWIKDNFKIRENAYDQFIQNKKFIEEQEVINKEAYRTTDAAGKEIIEAKKEKAIDLAMKKWDEKNNVWKHDSAWLNENTFRYLEPKEPSKHFSKEYNALKANPEVFAFYEYYTQLNQKMRRDSGLDINRTFIANRREGVMDTVINRGFNMSELAESISSAFLVHSEEETHYVTDEHGKRISSIPVLFINPLRDSKNNIDPSLKSVDLGQSLYLLANSVYNHKHMSEIEANLLTLSDYLAELGHTTTDRAGNIIYEGGEQVTTDVTDAATTDLYETFLKYYLYGQKIQTEDKVGPGGISMIKTVKTLKSIYSAKVLGFAIAPAIAARIVGGINMWIETIDGFNYNKKQMRAAQKMLVTNNRAFNAFVNYFDPYQQGLTWKKANDLSMKSVSGMLDLNHLYLPLRAADENMDSIVAVAMAMNHGIDPETGNLERLEDLPPDTKSMWDSFQENLNDKEQILINNLTQDAYEDFRLRVKEVMGGIKGAMDEQNIVAIDTSLIGDAMMQFKSWMPKLAEERFMPIGYNRTLKALEEGRYIGFFKGSSSGRDMILSEVGFNAILKHNAQRGIDAILNLAMLRKWTTNPAERLRLIEKDKWGPADQARYEKRVESLDAEFEAWKKNLPEDDPARNVSRKQFLAMRQRSVRRTLAELRAILGLMAAAVAMGVGVGPDDEKWHRKSWASRKLHLVLTRTTQELGFMLNPLDMASMLRGGIPLIGLFSDLAKVGTNGISEMGELLGIIKENPRDKSPFFYHTVKFVPGFNQLNRMVEFNDAGMLVPAVR